MAKRRARGKDETLLKSNPRRKLIGYCPYCHGVLCRMDIVPGNKSKRLVTRRVQCRYCHKTFKWSRLREERPLKDNGHRVRTKWSRPTMQSMIDTFVHLFNLHPLVTQQQIDAYKNQMVATGWDYVFVIKAEKTAARRTQWRDNDLLTERYMSQEQEPAHKMLPKFMRS